MKYIRTWVVVACVLAFATTRASAQKLPIAVQHLYFSLFNDYQDNILATNSVLTNEYALLPTAAIISGNVYRAVLYNLRGPEWTNDAGMEIVREVNLTNGAEGIYLRGYGRQTNISEFFDNNLGSSYIGDFTSQATNFFPALTNNFLVSFPITRANIAIRKDPSLSFTNILRQETMFFCSFKTTNLMFNWEGYGTYVSHPVRGRFVPGGTLYSNNIDTFIAHGIGTMYRTGGTNVFYQGNVPPNTNNTGIIYGTIWTGPPIFIGLTNGPQ